MLFARRAGASVFIAKVGHHRCVEAKPLRHRCNTIPADLLDQFVKVAVTGLAQSAYHIDFAMPATVPATEGTVCDLHRAGTLKDIVALKALRLRCQQRRHFEGGAGRIFSTGRFEAYGRVLVVGQAVPLLGGHAIGKEHGVVGWIGHSG